MENEFVLLPKRLTAENGAKGLLSGEFFETIKVSNDMFRCSECETGELTDLKVHVSWSTIKDIYSMIVDNLALNEAKSS